MLTASSSKMRLSRKTSHIVKAMRKMSPSVISREDAVDDKERIDSVRTYFHLTSEGSQQCTIKGYRFQFIWIPQGGRRDVHICSARPAGPCMDTTTFNVHPTNVKGQEIAHAPTVCFFLGLLVISENEPHAHSKGVCKSQWQWLIVLAIDHEQRKCVL